MIFQSYSLLARNTAALSSAPPITTLFSTLLSLRPSLAVPQQQILHDSSLCSTPFCPGCWSILRGLSLQQVQAFSSKCVSCLLHTCPPAYTQIHTHSILSLTSKCKIYFFQIEFNKLLPLQEHRKVPSSHYSLSIVHFLFWFHF